MKYACQICGWEYDEDLGDPENGIAPGTLFEELPDDFECPLCGVGMEKTLESPLDCKEIQLVHPKGDQS